MKKRILSLLLALCLLVGLLPTAAFAAEPEEALYAQMLELGLVDADGALIEDNTFTVEDGTWLSSLDELIEWLNQCDESDLDKIITVDATGNFATVEQFMYALSIEYQIADVAGQLNLLASGAYAATRAAGTGAVPARIHDMRLSMKAIRDGNILTLRVALCDKNDESTHYGGKRKIAAHQLGKNRQPPFWGCRLFAQSLYIWIPRQANFCGDAAGQAFQKEPEIWERPQTIGFRRLYNGVDSSACVSAVWRVGKQPVLPPNGKGAHSPFRPVVG